MVETISEDQYQQAVDENAAFLAEAVIEDHHGEVPADFGNKALDAVVDVLDGHEWFFKSQFGPAAHGCIIEHADSDPSRYTDMMSQYEGTEPTEIIKRVAYHLFEAAVVDEAKERLADEREAAE